ncbi:HNH endonuclease family protein [Variovorax atrisoli]|uniref:HNH endonuclease family protein n=1 Tax=Variovorax atrisoli TaxID=3394203 RepID=UPI00339B986B
MTAQELWTASKDDAVADASRRRNQVLQTFGNLTILSKPLNSAASNSPWSVKKPELLKHSLLPINQTLHDASVWDEAAIARRSDDLLVRALKVWPRDA